MTRRTTMTGLLLVALPTLGLVAPTPASATHPVAQAMTVELKTATGAIGGTVRVSTVPAGTRLQVDVRGLTPGFHGFHVHQTGACDGSTTPPFTSAGGHFDGAGRTHGAHAGDLPPLDVAADGTARADLVTDAFSVSDLQPEEGTRNRAFVVHAAPDNLANIPTRYRYGTFTASEAGPDTATLATGDSGGRVLCGATSPTNTAVAADPADAGAPSALATLRAPSGAEIGTVALRQLGDKVEVRGRLAGLTPGFHGMHVHTTGVCDGSTATPFSSAGGHLVGAGGTHGSHDGDLPALRVRADGTVDVDLDVDSVTVDEIFDADGAALIVHAAPDNLANIPVRYRYGAFADTETGPDAATKATGDSGGRAACGVLTNTAGAYRSTGPTRVLDTRTSTGRLGNGRTTTVPVVSTGDTTPYTSAALTVTAVQPLANARISVGSGGPSAVVNAPIGQVVATSVVAPVSGAGTVEISVAGGPTHVIVDVTGLFTTATPIGAGRYTPVTPTRVAPGRILGAGAVERVQLTGRAGVPSSGVAGVQLVLTATHASTPTHLTVFPGGTSRPSTSALNLRVGQARAASFAAAVSTDGAISVFNNSGTVTYLVDVVGWWSSTGTSGGRLVSLPSYGLRSTDDRTSGAPAAKLQSGRSIDVVLGGVGGVPGRGARAAVVSVTVSRPSSRSHLTVYPAGGPVPDTSNLNWGVGETLTTTVVVPLGRNGAIAFYNAGGTADLAVEVRGYVDAGPI